jgi:hypothetical protein
MAKERSQRAAPKSWKEVQAAYRIWLVNKGERKQEIGELGIKRKGMDPVQVIAAYEKQGMVPLGTCLQLRTRAFTRGVALGGAGYLEDLMAQYRSCFGPKRKKAARKIKAMGNDILAMRQV